MTTAGDIVNLALKAAGVLGVGQTALAEDSNDALTLMNQMIYQWRRKRWLIYHLVDTSFTCTGAQSYTVGAGGNFNITRPDRIEAAYFRQLIPSSPNQVDYPLQILESREDYSRISLKMLGSFPSFIWYDAAYPLGSVYPWPLPSSLYELHILTKDTLSSFANLATSIAIPEEYHAALLWNLAARLAPMYQKSPDPSVIALAKDSLNLIRTANAQIPRLTMPLSLVRRGIYNIYSDRVY